MKINNFVLKERLECFREMCSGFIVGIRYIVGEKLGLLWSPSYWMMTYMIVIKVSLPHYARAGMLFCQNKLLYVNVSSMLMPFE